MELLLGQCVCCAGQKFVTITPCFSSHYVQSHGEWKGCPLWYVYHLTGWPVMRSLCSDNGECVKAKRFSNCVLLLRNRKIFMWDLCVWLAALGIICTRNFSFSLWQGNGHLISFFFSYVIFTPFRNLDWKKMLCFKIPSKNSSSAKYCAEKIYNGYCCV